MLRSLIPCILFCALSALILGQKGAGFMLYVLVPVILVYMAVSAWRIRNHKGYQDALQLELYHPDKSQTHFIQIYVEASSLTLFRLQQIDV